MKNASYTSENPIKPALGLIVLSVDETIEQEFRVHLPPKDARLHVSRLAAATELTRDGILQMEDGLQSAAALLPQAATFAAIGFACTSGTAILGADGIARHIAKSGVTTTSVTDPLSATCERARHLGVRRIGIVSPYVDDVANSLGDAIGHQGFTVPDALSFGEGSEARVARIAPASVADAARALASRTSLDAVFLSCTNLRTLPIRATLEKELGIPVLTSNHSLAWQMAKLANIDLHEPET